MNWSNLTKGAVAVAFLASATTQAEAMEIVGGPSTAGYSADGFVQKVVVVRHGPHGGAVVRPGVHPGYHGHRPGYGYHPGNRPGYPGYRPGYAGWARPGWYHWGPGGAIAAGAAIGVLGAAAVAAWAPPPPAPGLCWYYTDPSQRNGFWDACQ